MLAVDRVSGRRRRAPLKIAVWASLLVLGATICPALVQAETPAPVQNGVSRPPHHGHGQHGEHGDCHAGDCCADTLRPGRETSTVPAPPAGTVVAAAACAASRLRPAEVERAGVVTGLPGSALPQRC